MQSLQETGHVSDRELCRVDSVGEAGGTRWRSPYSRGCLIPWRDGTGPSLRRTTSAPRSGPEAKYSTHRLTDSTLNSLTQLMSRRLNSQSSDSTHNSLTPLTTHCLNSQLSTLNSQTQLSTHRLNSQPTDSTQTHDSNSCSA